MLIAIGAAVFVVGASLALLAVRSGDGGGKDNVQTAATVPAAKPGDVLAPGATLPSFEIPTGKQALAVQMPYVSGVAGFAKAKDKVNVFGTIKPGDPVPRPGMTPAASKLIISDVEVLYVSTPTPGTPTTFVLALAPAEAEQVVFFQTFQTLYLSLARSDQGAVSTPGRAATSAF